MGYVNGTVGYTANGLNQYTAAGSAAPTYDMNGNLTGEGTWTYGYDQDNRLRTASKTGVSGTLRYDPEGPMRQTDFGPFNIRNLLYDGTDLVTMYNATGNVMHRYVFGPGIDEPIVWYEGSVTGTKTWLFADHLGSIVALDGSSTGIKTYGPYGEPLPASAAGDRFRYTGQQMVSELGLYYYKARFYSPALGRFLQADPVGYQSDLNLYAYVGNDPVNLTDPTGEFIAGALLGAAIETALQLNANGADFSNLGLEDLRNINISNVVIAAAVGALAPGYLNVAKTAVTSGKAVNNLLSQVPNANTVDRFTKIGNRIEDIVR